MPGITAERRVEQVTAEPDAYWVADLASPEEDQGRTVQVLGSFSVAGWGIEE